MKAKLILISIFTMTIAKAQYVGINTLEPQTTLEVIGSPENSSIADGILLPKITLKQLNAKTSYSKKHAGTLIYITDITGGSTKRANSLITSVGQYYFDGENWLTSNQQSKFLHTDSENQYGPGAGNANIEGTRNTGFGNHALSSSIYESENTAFGNNALQSNNSGSHNTAIGYHSLSHQSQIGDGNTALGALSLYNNSGSRNTGVGKESLYATTGDHNTAIGYGSGFGISSGTKNISIGAYSGTVEDFSYTIAIGADAKATKSNQIVLGTNINSETVLFGKIKNNDALLYYADPTVYNYFIAGAGPDNFDQFTKLSYGNTAAGHAAMHKVDNSMMNTAFGFQALQKLQNGADNTAFGAGALQNQIGGVGNSALGRLALANSTSGTNNTGLGDTALEFTLGNQNTAVGYSAGIKAVTGNYNSLFGVFAGGHYLGRNAPDGTYSYCNIFGAESMMSNISGSNNNLFGYRAGHLLTGANNAGFGHEVFRYLTNGFNNTAFGNNTAWDLTTGSDNIFIGFEAGKNPAQKKDATGTTVIGSYAYSTRDNEVVIGKETDTHITLLGVEFTREELLQLKAMLSKSKD